MLLVIYVGKQINTHFWGVTVIIFITNLAATLKYWMCTRVFPTSESFCMFPMILHPKAPLRIHQCASYTFSCVFSILLLLVQKHLRTCFTASSVDWNWPTMKDISTLKYKQAEEQTCIKIFFSGNKINMFSWLVSTVLNVFAVLAFCLTLLVSAIIWKY